MSYLIGTDIGTMGTKTVLVDPEGKVLANSFREYGVLTPMQGWAEQWPQVWAEATYATIRETVQRSKVGPKEIAGACVSSLYGGSGIPVDRNYTVIRPCLIWADRRATDECRWVEEKIGRDALFEATGNVIDPYYGYTKMLWIRDKEPLHWSKVHRFETPNGYCIRQLTGAENIDYSSAGNYGGVFDIHRRTWSAEMMEELGIPADFFPDKIHSSDEVVGEISDVGARLTGLAKGTPLCAGGIDAAVSALAGGAIKDGDLASMLGTSMCNGFISHKPRFSPRMINFPYVVNGREYLYSFTGIATAGFCVRWFRDNLGVKEMTKEKETGEDAYKQLDTLARGAPIGSGSLVFMPHMMVGERAPYWDEQIRGGFLGLTTYHTRAHMFRAVLEGVAYAMRYSIEAAWETGIKINRATLVDGGAQSPLWRQIIADVTGVEMSYIPGAQGAPLGDAMLAGLGTGVIGDHKVIEDWIGEKVPMKPKPSSVKKYRRFYELYKQCLESTRPLFKAMAT
ncbi:FGGY-family carbohydrate kinase [Candidatus Bathyarchaeota archaeon]|nr:FGGY-family carbohydrate kinase [Candidatus Bathyarchaeota archaeon]